MVITYKQQLQQQKRFPSSKTVKCVKVNIPITIYDYNLQLQSYKATSVPNSTDLKTSTFASGGSSVDTMTAFFATFFETFWGALGLHGGTKNKEKLILVNNIYFYFYYYFYFNFSIQIYQRNKGGVNFIL